MSANDSQASAALVTELSFSFQDELTATIHNAFGVAVEIAVLEVTKLVGQALRDVRDQMHETLRENKSLKQRLQAAELELNATRGRLESESQLQSAAVAKTNSVGRVNQQSNTQTDTTQSYPKPAKHQRVVEPTPVDRNGTLLDVEEKFSFLDVRVETSAPHNRSFCEIREDGQVRSHDLNPDLEGEAASKPGLGNVTASKNNQTCMYTNTQVETVHFDQACPETNPRPDTLGDNIKGQSLLDTNLQNPKVEQPVKVKEESSDLGCVSGSAPFTGAEDDFGSDSLSLAQSRLLEDWRPEPLHLQNCDTDPLIPCTSHSLSDSDPVFGTDLPELDIHVPPSSSLPPAYSKPYPSQEPVPHPPYVTRVSSTDGSLPSAPVPTARVHVCRVCGESFRLQEELRRHRSQHHSQNQGHGAKSVRHPKRQAFPPGRSPYHCSLCGRDFNRMEHLKIHQRIHTGERPYACSVCNARFRHSWALTRHFRIHTGEKPYACSLCGKTFRNCGGLRFHQRSHSMEGNA